MKKPLAIASEEDFSSDVSPIKEQGLDISNPVDEAIFKNYLQRQVWEIAIELGVSHYFSLSEVLEKLKMWTGDIIDHNCFGGEVTVNAFSGEPQLTYLYPYEIYTIGGKQPSGKDALGKGWERTVTVREIIALMGNDLNDESLEQLLSHANAESGQSYKGIWYPEIDATQPMGTCSYNTFLGMTARLGKLEIKSQNSDAYLNKKKGNNFITEKVDIDYKPPKKSKVVNSKGDLEHEDDVNLEYTFYDVTYKAYYIPSTKLVWGFGKVPLAVRYGTKNELTDFSIISYNINGKSMCEKC